VNARGPDGLVHEVEKYPQLHSANPNHVTHAGFTWCMEFFTWVDGPRFHVPADSVEARFEKTEDAPNCLGCVGYVGPWEAL
jgi:hypothetical protein